jgi:hypothetical protein
MKKKLFLRLTGWMALGLFAIGFSVWIGAGARIGWTQTSVVAMHHDEITGIDYPVRQAAFRPGVEVPLLATATAATLAGIAYVTQRRREARITSR